MGKCLEEKYNIANDVYFSLNLGSKTWMKSVSVQKSTGAMSDDIYQIRNGVF